MNIRALVIAGLVFLGTSLIGNDPASAQNYSIVRSVIAAGGTPMSNGTYTVDGTIGQAVIGISQSSVFTNYQGFWYTAKVPSGVKINTDGNADGFALDQNYPNPFNPTTHLRFTIAELRFVSLKIYDVLGREVATLVDGEKKPGVYEMSFNASRLSSGVYYYRLSAGNYTEVKRMMLLK
jgi:hypothetical protein